MKEAVGLKTPKNDYAKLVKKLSIKEKEAFLVRLANSEIRLDIKLKKHLEQLK